MDNKSDEQLLIMRATIDANRQFFYEKMKNCTENLTEMIESMMDQIKISKYSPDKEYSPKVQYPTTVAKANKKYQPLEGGYSTKIGGMWNLKHGISSPKFYELLVKT